MSTPYPLTFEPMLLEKVWGGDRLSRFGKPVPPGGRIGESWEVADLRETSASGAGGGAKQSVIAHGPLTGKTLGEAIDAWGASLIEPTSLTSAGGFPLLVKLLDAREHLSVQVHPSPEFSAAHADAHLKTECWYILDAEPGADGEPAVIYKGFKPGVTPDEYERAIGEGRVAELLNAVPAVVGEMHDLPSGTIHALGAGVLVAEVQTPSDTTFRVHDWQELYERPQREMHVEQALASTLFDDAPGARSGAGELVANGHYRVREVRGHCEAVELGASGCCVVMCVSGMGSAIAGDGFEEVALSVGSSVLVPSACSGSTLRMGPGSVCLVAEVV